jgi:hypothetical protein
MHVNFAKVEVICRIHWSARVIIYVIRQVISQLSSSIIKLEGSASRCDIDLKLWATTFIPYIHKIERCSLHRFQQKESAAVPLIPNEMRYRKEKSTRCQRSPVFHILHSTHAIIRRRITQRKYTLHSDEFWEPFTFPSLTDLTRCYQGLRVMTLSCILLSYTDQRARSPSTVNRHYHLRYVLML